MDEPAYCTGCGRLRAVCTADRPCGRAGPEHPVRFCPDCGWRLRDIAVVPGLGGRWCREHGVIDSPT